jgi:16S rRNA (cytidine1402-2'-O)-methyltransferase
VAEGTGTLYLVGTPIGNLGDLSDRARRTLADADVIACEDTRRTGRLLTAFDIPAPRLISFFDGNERRRVAEVLELLRDGLDVAVVSDAGMPGLSDPGYRVVAASVAEGIEVDVVPGPSAAVAALVVSGLPTDRFVFEGFLPRSGKHRSERLAALASELRTIVLFESPHRLAATLGDLRDALGDRRVAVARELTKLHQEVVRGTLSSVVTELGGRDVKGEVVVVVEGAEEPVPSEHDAAAAVRLASSYVGDGAKKREAARRAAAETGVSAREIYDALVAEGRDSA